MFNPGFYVAKPQTFITQQLASNDFSEYILLQTKAKFLQVDP